MAATRRCAAGSPSAWPGATATSWPPAATAPCRASWTRWCTPLRPALEAGLPGLAYAAGVIGDYALLVTAPAAAVPALVADAGAVEVGHVQTGSGVVALEGGRPRALSLPFIAELAEVRDAETMLGLLTR